MADQYKLNYILIGLVLLGIVTFLYLQAFMPLFTSDLFLSPIFVMAEIGSLCLYGNFFLKNKGLQNYCLIVIVIVSIIIFSAFDYYYNPTLFWTCEILLPFLWMLGCIHFIFRIVSVSTSRPYVINNLCIFLIPPLFVMLSKSLLILNAPKNPLVQDEFLMAMDGSLGIYPSLIMGRFIRSLPQILNNGSKLLYMSLPLAFILVFIRRQSIDKKQHYEIIIESILIGIAGASLYNIIPACGSASAFYNTWPDSLPTQFLQEGPKLIYCPTTIPRNCMPSLHMAWLICLLRYAWLCDPITKIFMLVLAIGNLIAMFGIGVHYFIDLIVGFAFANCIGGLSAFQLSWGNKARWQAMLFGGLLCLGWYVLIIYGIPVLQTSKILACLIFLASIVLSAGLEWNLFKEHSRVISKHKAG